MAQVQSLVRELRSRKPRGTARKKKKVKLQKEPNGNPVVEKYLEIKFILKEKKRKPFCKLGIAKRNKHLRFLVQEWVEG